MRTFFLAVVAMGVVAVSSADGQQAAKDSVLRVLVEVPDSAGVTVTLRYVEGPDSLRGKTQELVVPAEFRLPAQRVTLVAERTKGHGMLRLRVERLGTNLRGEGLGDRVSIVVSDSGIAVRVHPWWLPW